MITLNERSNIWLQELYPLLAGIGIGMLFHTPFQVVTNLLPKRDLASATGAFFLVRFIGTTTGLVRTCPLRTAQSPPDIATSSRSQAQSSIAAGLITCPMHS